MTGPNIGFSTLSVIPSLRGMDQAVNSQLGAAGAAGRRAGDAVAKGMRSRLGGATKGIFGSIKSLLPVVGIGAGAGLLKGAKDAARDLNESISKVNAVFLESGPVIQAWSKSSARDLGIPRQEALEAAGTFGNLFRSMGVGVAPTTDMSKSIVGLGADLVSFNNADPTEVLLALRAGLVGEAEPLRKFGVNISAARVEAEALALGLAKPVKNMAKITQAQVNVEKSTLAVTAAQKKHGEGSVEARDAAAKVALAEDALATSLKGSKVELTAAQKLQASYAIIMKDTTLAQGDRARTAHEAAGAEKTQAAEFKNLQADLGQGLLPVYKALLSLTTFLTRNFQTFLPVIAGLTAVFIAYKIGVLATTIATQGLTTSMLVLLSPVFLIVAALIAVGVAAFIFRDKIAAALGGVGRFFQWVFGGILNFLSTWGGRLLGFITAPIGLMLTAFRTFKGKVVGIFRGIGSGIVGALKSGLNVVIGLLERGVNLALAPARKLSTMPIIGAAIPDIPKITIPRLAKGGDVLSSGLSIIAERGPEMVHLPQGARVTPLPASARMTRNGAATLRMVSGELTLNKSGRAFFQGIVQEELDAERAYDERVRTMRG